MAPEIQRPNEILDSPDLYDSLCVIRGDDTRKRDDLKTLYDAVRDMEGWRDLDSVYLTGFGTRAYSLRFHPGSLDAAHARLMREFPNLGVFRHRTYKFTPNLIITPESSDMDANLLLTQVQTSYGPVSSLPGYEAHTCRRPGPRLIFDSVKAASDALAKLDGREAGVRHPWAVRYDQTQLSPWAKSYATANLKVKGTFQGEYHVAKRNIADHLASLPDFRGAHIKPSPGRGVFANVMFNSTRTSTNALEGLLHRRIGPVGNVVIFRNGRYTESAPWFDDPKFSRTCTLVVEGRGQPPRLEVLENKFKSLPGFKNVKEVGVNPLGKNRLRILVELNTPDDTVAAHASINQWNKPVVAAFSRFLYDEFKL